MKNLKLIVCLLLAAILPNFASALIVGPYTPDANTAYLFHLDEPAGSSVATNAAGTLSVGTNAISYNGATFAGAGVNQPTVTTVLGATGYTGFGNAADLSATVNLGVGVDNNGDGAYMIDNRSATPSSADRLPNHSTIFGAGNAFTLEALVKVSTITSGNQEIICTDNGDSDNIDRGFQFRINGSGQLEFNFIGVNTSTTVKNIPTTATDPVNGFVANEWFHVAYSYDGTTGTFYWTRLDSANTAANSLGTAAEGVDINDDACLVLGNEGRSANGTTDGSTEGLKGFIDEVRISKVARAADDMMFNSPVLAFVTHPAPSQTIVTNHSTSLTVLATGPGTVAYQWYSFTGSATNALLDETNSTLTINAGSSPGESNYFAVASNGGVSTPATSHVATVSIIIPQNMQWAGIGADWDFATANWTTNGNVSQTSYAPLAAVTFDSLGAGQPVVNITTNFQPVSVIVDTAGGDYSLGGTGTGTIGGTGSLTKKSSGTLTLTTANSYSGGTSINAGTVELDGAGLFGTGPVLNNGGIVVSNSNTPNLSASISGTGGIAIEASTTLSASNSYAGTTTVDNNSTLYVTDGSALGDISSGTVINAGSKLYINAGVNFGAEPLTLNGLAAGGALEKNGGSAGTFGGPITLGSDGKIGVDGGGTLNLTNAAGIDGSAANASVYLVGSGAGMVSGPLSLGNGGISVGSGTWTFLSAANNYNGPLSVSTTFNFMSDTAFGNVPGSLNASQITIPSSGTLNAMTNVSLVDGNRGINISGTALNLSAASGSTFMLSNPMSGSGVTITANGAGTVELAGDYGGSLIGVLNVSGGNLRAAYPTALGGFATINLSGTATLQLDGSNGALVVAPLNLTWSGRNSLIPAIENISGNNSVSYGLSVTWNTGGGTFPIQSDAGTLTVNIPMLGTAPAGFRTALFSGSGNIAMAATVDDNPGTTTNNVIKTGNGTLILQANNTYTGGTIISNGLVQVDGSIAAGGAVTNIGGALGGVGTINSPVFILPGATLAPGDSIGTLTINSDLDLAGVVSIEVNKSLSPGQSNDVVMVSGVLTNSAAATVNVSNLGPALAFGDKFFLFNQPVTNGAAMSVTGAGVVWNNNLAVDGSVSVASTVNTSPVTLTNTFSSSSLILSWPADHLGWHLQAQTNTLSHGLGTNWVDVPNSSSVTSVTNAISPNNGTVFYRLYYPGN